MEDYEVGIFSQLEVQLASSDISGKVQTVLGPVEPSDLGITLSHEHLVYDFSANFEEPVDPDLKSLAAAPVSMGILGWLRHNWRCNLDNLSFQDVDTASEEVSHFAKAGGKTVVDTTSIGIGRNPKALVSISRATGLNIVMGAGYYVANSHPPEMDRLTEDDIASEIARDITDGVDGTGIKSGLIGEIGCSWPLHPNERKVLRAAARAHLETGAPLSIHPGRSEEAPFEIVEELRSVGADLSRTIICHIGRTIYDIEKLAALARTGVVLEWDLFGHEDTHYPFNEAPTPTDAQRIAQIKWLIDQGFQEQVVVSHDICTKQRLVRYGGHGFAHILRYVLPRMRRAGIGEEQIELMLQATPRRVFAFA